MSSNNTFAKSDLSVTTELSQSVADGSFNTPDFTMFVIIIGSIVLSLSLLLFYYKSFTKASRDFASAIVPQNRIIQQNKDDQQMISSKVRTSSGADSEDVAPVFVKTLSGKALETKITINQDNDPPPPPTPYGVAPVTPRHVEKQTGISSDPSTYVMDMPSPQHQA